MNNQMNRYIGPVCKDPKHKSFYPCGIRVHHPLSTSICSPTRDLPEPCYSMFLISRFR